jgi:PST family polysaccharide transporter
MRNFQKQESTSKEGALESGPSRSGFFSGVVRQAGARWFAQILSWASTIVVARLLTSEDYGLVAMAVVYLNVAAMVAELGLGATIVARQELTDHHIDQLYSLAGLVGGVIFLLTWSVAPALAGFFGEPRLRDVVRVMALGTLLTALATVPLARARRDLDYRLVSRVELLGAVTTTATVLGLALLGARFWSLVFGNVIGSGVMVVALRLASPARFARPCLAQLGATLKYSRHITTQQLAYFACVYSDSLVIGRFIGAAPLGLYRFAAQIVSLPSEKIVNVIGSVTLPYFGKLSTDLQAMRGFFLTISELLATAVIPVLVGMALVANDFVPLVFGIQWAPSIPLIQVTTVGAIIQVLSVLVGQVLTVTNQARLASRYTLLSLVILPMTYLLGIAVSPQLFTIALIWSLAQPCMNLLAFRQVLRTLGVSATEYLGALVPACAGTAIMAIAVLGMQRVMQPDASAINRLIGSVATGGLAYGSVHWGIFRRRNAALLQLFRAS